MPADPRRIKELFVAALDLPDAEARRAWLDRECGDDPELRQRVESLLQAHDHPASLLEQPLAAAPALDPTVDYTPAGDPGGLIAGRYRLAEKIGEGGMGEVWSARQVEPVKRKVAVKLIKAGMDSKQVVARFEAERQALALMDHPNIARVYDGGLTESGRPFFAMELVNGLPITRYCDEARLPTKDRLTLFLAVCRAVQHAHQKGIVHRDLKPSNVLVTLYDGVPVPKVIDFGIAKAVGGHLTEHSLSTHFGAVVGTVEYMAPEQAAYSAVDVDTRADIYSLGVILYELLTGLRPFDPERFKRAAFDEMLRIIREEEPQRPSIRLTTAEKAPSSTAARRIEPHRLASLLRGELDWVVMRCLEKDRGRRYETANALGRDVQHYLALEPVEARPPSASYRLRKFARRHRGPVAAASLVVLTLLLGMIGTFVGMVQANIQRGRAVMAETAGRNERKQAEEARAAVELAKASLQIDLDLAVIHDEEDYEKGLLRLARTLKGLPEEATSLREFATTAVLTLGQVYAPLLPPISHDGHAVERGEISSDGRVLLTLGEDRTARLWDALTAREIATLRRGKEHVNFAAITPDNHTIVTDSDDGVIRFWNVPEGTFRAESEPRLAIADPKFRVSSSRVLTMSWPAGEGGRWRTVGPVELWDTASGRRVARLDQPGQINENYEFAAEGRWVTTVRDRTRVLVFSSEDGNVLGRLSHENLGLAGKIEGVFNLANRRLMTVVSNDGAESSRKGHLWEDATWTQSSFDIRACDFPSQIEVFDLPGGLFAVFQVFDKPTFMSDFGRTAYSLHRPGMIKPVVSVDLSFAVDETRGFFGRSGESVFDLQRGLWSAVPPDRNLHPLLSHFARPGRFVVDVHDCFINIIDSKSDKFFNFDMNNKDFFAHKNVTQIDHWSHSNLYNDKLLGSSKIMIIPLVVPEIHPEDLELWAQVTVRGEIGPMGEFSKWDEPTWGRKREQLESLATNYSNYFFPGHVTQDRLHWLRREYGEAALADSDRLHLAEELLRRSAEDPNPHESVRWGAIVGNLKAEEASEATGEIR